MNRRYARDVLKQFDNENWKYATIENPTDSLEEFNEAKAKITNEALAQMKQDLLAALPPKYKDINSKSLQDGFEHDVGFNAAVEQATQAIKDYFKEDK